VREGPDEVSACKFSAIYTYIFVKAYDVYFVIRRLIIGVMNVKFLEVRAAPTTIRIYIVLKCTSAKRGHYSSKNFCHQPKEDNSKICVHYTRR
jgi:hypothetical protein